MQTLAQESTKTLAVVIGISAYENNGVKPLQFANKDAYVFADYLQSPAGGNVPEENVRLLLDEDATNSAVYQAIDWLKATAKQGDLVYFYFSGHGDLENVTMYNNGYLICYNSPPNNYVMMAFSINFLNDIANTLSVQTKAKVVLITDACHAGKVAGESNRGSFLVGEQLLAVKDKEVRIASCQTDQLSNENEQWGGGRGVFSYYLVNGLQGQADLQNDGIITAGELQTYLAGSLSKDPILKSENVKQTPVVKGEKDFAMGKVPIKENGGVEPGVLPIDGVMGGVIGQPETQSEEEKEFEKLSPSEFFLKSLSSMGIKNSFETLEMADKTAKRFVFAMLEKTIQYERSDAGQQKLLDLKNALSTAEYLVDRLNKKIAALIDDEGQRVLNLYLQGDEAELEKRRYYNLSQNSYAVYPAMYSFAMELTPEDSYLYRILKVKCHYFSAIVNRLAIPSVVDGDSLYRSAYTHIDKALGMESYAAYLYNERGILRQMKDSLTLAEADYTKSIELSPDWALPRSNLGGLLAFEKKFNLAEFFLNAADSIQPGFLGVYTNKGYVYEQQKNYWSSEEYYRKAIKINSRHFLPFERLAIGYTQTKDYALSDSFYYEAEKRKAGYHFQSLGVSMVAASDVLQDGMREPCIIDSAVIGKTDVLGHFAVAMKYFMLDDAISLRWLLKTISLDEHNPLAYHYAAILYRKSNALEAADLFFSRAKSYSLSDDALELYAENLSKKNKERLSFPCTKNLFAHSGYNIEEDDFYRADVAEQMNYYFKAENIYKQFIKAETNEITSYKLLEALYEKQERYDEADELWNDYKTKSSTEAYLEQYAFYKRMIYKFPAERKWTYKLGLLLYDKAAQPSMGMYLDTIVYFPKLGVEAFITEEMRKNELDRPESPYAIDAAETGAIENLNLVMDDHGPQAMSVPGTGRTFLLQPMVMTPRLEAVFYLKRTDSFTIGSMEKGNVLHKIANVYEWAGSATSAQEFYKKAYAYLPLDAGNTSKYISTSRAIFYNEEALATLQQLQQEGRLDINNRMLLLEAYWRKGMTLATQKEIDTATSIYHIPNTKLLQIKAHSLVKEKKYSEAIASYKQIVDNRITGSDNVYSIATVYAMENNTAQALRYLNIAIQEGFNYKYVLQNDPAWEKMKENTLWKDAVVKIGGIDYK